MTRLTLLEQQRISRKILKAALLDIFSQDAGVHDTSSHQQLVLLRNTLRAQCRNTPSKFLCPTPRQLKLIGEPKTKVLALFNEVIEEIVNEIEVKIKHLARKNGKHAATSSTVS